MSDIEVNLGSFASEIQARLEAGEKEIGDLKQYIVGLRGSLNREDYKGINEERAARVIAERRLLDAREQEESWKILANRANERADQFQRELKEAREVTLWLWNNLGHDDKEYIPTWVAGPVRSYRDAARAAVKGGEDE